MDKGGFIVLHRKIMNTSFYHNINAARLAIHLLLLANHKDKKIVFNKQELTIKRGQLVTGLKSLSKSSSLTSQMTRTSLKILENCGFLTSKSTNKFRIITICKYESYQSLPDPNNKQNNKQVTIKQQSNNKQLTTNNTLNNVNNKNNHKQVRSSNDVSMTIKKNSKYIVFNKPSYKEVNTYCKDRQNGINAQHFIDFYESKGWMVGKNKMKDWKAAIRTWEQRSNLNQAPKRIEPDLPQYPEISDEDREKIHNLVNKTVENLTK